MCAKGKLVCVTGSSGYIASRLIILLLQNGYRVHATERDLKLIDPAEKGTLNVLKSCARFHSIRRVIITSSLATVQYSAKPLGPDVIVNESWFSDPDFCKQHKLWYQLGKTLAEEAAWKFAKENRIELITMHPGFVIGTEEYPNGHFRCIDIRDVAYAHIQALEISSAAGRYCLIESDEHFSDILKLVHQYYPTLQLPQKCGTGINFLMKYGISKEKAKTLGIDFIPFEVSLRDTIESLKEKGFLSI